jgi:hypothetical protein
MGRARLAVPIAFLIAAIPAYAQSQSCALSGTVVARSIPTGAFVDRAEVSIPRLDKSTSSDSAGRFRLTGLVCGRHEVQVRKIGFTVLRDTVDLRIDSDSGRVFTLISVAQLDTVRTTGNEIQYQSPLLQDFEARRKKNIGGYFIGEADLRRIEGTSMQSILRSKVPGLQFTFYRNIQAARGRHSAGMNGDPRINPDDPRSPTGCWVTIYQDGVMLFDGTPKRGSLPPDIGQMMAGNLSGVEYYSGAAAMPLQFKNTLNNCGTLLFWTRGR